jgi:hypothetical protein
MRKIIFICLAVLATLTSFGQKTKKERREERRQRINEMIKQEEEGVIAYHKHTAFGLKLNTDGYGAFLEIGRASSIKKALLFQLDISERKHPKEEKQTNIAIPTSPFIFGKINYFYPVKLGVQQQILLGNKTNRNGVSVTGNIGGGISLALLRPYFLEVNDQVNGTRKFIRYESADSVIFKDPGELSSLQVSGSGLSKGWGQMKVTPGAYAKLGLRFDYGRFNEMLNAIEVGIAADIYTKKIPQLLYNDPKQFFFGAYVSIMFGKRK